MSVDRPKMTPNAADTSSIDGPTPSSEPATTSIDSPVSDIEEALDANRAGRIVGREDSSETDSEKPDGKIARHPIRSEGSDQAEFPDGERSNRAGQWAASEVDHAARQPPEEDEPEGHDQRQAAGMASGEAVLVKHADRPATTVDERSGDEAGLDPLAGDKDAEPLFHWGRNETVEPTPDDSSDLEERGIRGIIGEVVESPDGTGATGDVLDETTNHAGPVDFTSLHSLSPDEAMEMGIHWLGDGYSQIGKPDSGVFRSADGVRQFRMDENSLLGNHAPRPGHVHFEIYAPGANRPLVNNHVPLDFGR